MFGPKAKHREPYRSKREYFERAACLVALLHLVVVTSFVDYLSLHNAGIYRWVCHSKKQEAVCMGLTKPFESTLLECATQMQLATDPWWIIGSVSMALHGIDPEPIGDIDILVSKKDGLALGQTWGCENCADLGAGRFRSEILLKHRVLGVDVEVMAGLEVRQRNRWHPVLPKTRQKIMQIGRAHV